MAVDQKLHDAILPKVRQVFSPEEIRNLTPGQAKHLSNLLDRAMSRRGAEVTVEEIQGIRELIFDHLSLA